MKITRRHMGMTLIALAFILLLAMSVILNGLIIDKAETAALDSNRSDLIEDDLLILNRTERTDGKVFNNNALTALYKKLAGENATYATVAGLAAQAKSDTTKNIHSGKNSGEIRKDNGGNDIVVKVGELEWIVTSLSTDKNGNPIVTLWLKDTTDKVEWNKWYANNSSYAYPSNMYSSSYIRAYILDGIGSSNEKIGYVANEGDESLTDFNPADRLGNYPYGIFTKNNASGSITKYIVKPKDIPYQEVGTIYSVSKGICNWPAGANEALKTVEASQWGQKYNEVALQNKTGYYNWGEDYIWLPALAETGWSDQGVAGMWNMDSTSRAGSDRTWTRSGNSTEGINYANLVEANGNHSFTNVNSKLLVRPAFHLNLKLANDDALTYLDAPILSVSNPYNGLEQNLGNITDKTKTKWYDSTKIDVVFEGNMTDVGTYKGKATITAPGTVFKGMPNTTDPLHMESDAVRWFEYTITKKPIGVDTSLKDNVPQAVAKSGAVYSRDSGDKAPKFGFTYKSSDGKSYTQYPTGIIGDYTAAVNITNECNYMLDDTYTIDFSIQKTRLPEFSIDTSPKEYYGGTYTFNLSPKTNLDKIKVTVNSPATYKDGVVTLKEVGKYTVTIALADDGKDTCWDTADNSIAPYDIILNVTQKKLTPTITCSDEDYGWEFGEAPTFTITDDRVSGENVDYRIYYLKSGSDRKYDFADEGMQFTANGLVLTMPNDFPIGNYKLGVELADTNGNYYIEGTSKTRDFSVVGSDIKVTASSIKWQVNNKAIDELTNGKLILTYNGSPFKFGVDDSNLKDLGVKIDSSKQGTIDGFSGKIEQTDVGDSFAVTVHLCNYDDTYETYSGSFDLIYEIQKGKYDLSKVKWNYNSNTVWNFNNDWYTVEITIGMPSGLSVKETDYDGNKQKFAGDGYVAKVVRFTNSNTNYVTPLSGKPETYDGEFEWSVTWSIGKATIDVEWEDETVAGLQFKVPRVIGNNGQHIDSRGYMYYKYVDGEVGEKIPVESIEVGDSAVRYWIEAVLTENAQQNYVISEDSKMTVFIVGSNFERVNVELEDTLYMYDGTPHGGKLKMTLGTLDISKIHTEYYKDSVDDANKVDGVPVDAGNYVIVLSLDKSDEENGYLLSKTQLTYTIDTAKIIAVWNTNGQIPVLANLDENLKEVVGYIYYDAEGKELEAGATLEMGKTYRVKAIIKGNYSNNYAFIAEDGETILEDSTATGEEEFTLKDKHNGDGNNVGIGSGDPNAGAIDELLAKLMGLPLWQLIVSVISIILTIIFMSKTASYNAKRKKFNKKTDKIDKVYAVGAFLGIASTIWTAIACVLIALAVVSLIIMLVAKSRCNKAEEEYEDRLDEYNRIKAESDERKRDENMRMMLMGMLGNNGGQFSQQGASIDDMRMMINDAVTAMLPNVQQYLPQQASTNDDLVEKLLEKTEKNEETIQKLMRKIVDQPTEKVIAREVAVANANDETVKTILEGQRVIMQQLAELSAKQNNQPQVVEKVIEKEVPVEKIVEKVVEVPVGKIVEKQVVKEVKVEAATEKSAPSKPKKEVAPKLTLDEAYAGLSKQQQKYFDGLRQYALSKPGSKEKKSTYFTVFGQSTVNPLMKLTIKKDTVVALFKMEDEYLKDIKRDASGDGTKIKVKETEVVIADAQACKAAKNMIDLREDQIERYNDLLKEQRAMKRK